LWHWPLLVFARINEGHTPSIATRSAIVLLSIALAWLTYRIIEVPIRFGNIGDNVIPKLCGAMGCVFAFAVFAYGYDGLSFRLGDRMAFESYFDDFVSSKDHSEEVRQILQNQCNFFDYKSAWPTGVPVRSINSDCYMKHSDRSVMIWGDSHAAHLYYGIREILPRDISTLLIFGSGCKLQPANPANIKIDYCEKTNDFALSVARQQVPDIVLLASNAVMDIAYLRQIVTVLKTDGVRHVMVLGSVPHWQPSLYKVIMRNYWTTKPRRIVTHQDYELVRRNAEFRSKISAADVFEYVNPSDAFCNGDGCLTYLGDDLRDGLVTFDYGHLRSAASVYLANTLLGPLLLHDLQESTARN
jgi:SGNH domain (fused to AT3 domains)